MPWLAAAGCYFLVGFILFAAQFSGPRSGNE